MNWFTALANAAAYFLQIKATSAAHDLTERIEETIWQDQREIEHLRGLGDPDSQLRADFLRRRILRKQGVATAITPAAPAASVEAAGGGRGADA